MKGTECTHVGKMLLLRAVSTHQNHEINCERIIYDHSFCQNYLVHQGILKDTKSTTANDDSYNAQLDLLQNISIWINEDERLMAQKELEAAQDDTERFNIIQRYSRYNDLAELNARIAEVTMPTISDITRSECACLQYQRNLSLLQSLNPYLSDAQQLKVYSQLMATDSSKERFNILKTHCRYEMDNEVKKIVDEFNFSGCANCPARKRETYTSMRNEFNAATKEVDLRRLTKVELKALLYYHFLCDENGFGKDIDLNSVAEVIGCHVKSLHQANKNLRRLGYIEYSHLHKQLPAGHIVLYILNRKNNYLTADQGGTGYVVLSAAFLREILNNNYEINEIRTMIRALLADDEINMDYDNKQKFEERKDARLTVKDSSRFFDAYLRYPKKIKEKFESIQETFNCSIQDQIIHLKLKNKFNGKFIVTQIKEFYRETVQNIKQHCDLIVSEGEEESVALLCKQYGVKRVIQGLDSITAFLEKEREGYEKAIKKAGTSDIKYHYTKRKDIRNFGAYLRRTIEKLIIKEKMTLI